MSAITKPEVLCYTDGSAMLNESAGAGIYLQNSNGSTCSISVHVPNRNTNSEAEVYAIWYALSSLKKPCSILIHTDNMYCCNAINQWIEGWSKRNWKNASKKDVGQKDLWIKIYALMQIHDVTAKHVKAHSGIELNELVDKLADAGRRGIESKVYGKVTSSN